MRFTPLSLLLLWGGSAAAHSPSAWPAPSSVRVLEDDVVALPHARLEAELAALCAAHPDVARRVRIATSREGRSVEALHLRRGERDAPRPGVLLVANLEGPRTFESALAMRLARLLVEASADGEEESGGLRRLLDDADVWIVPRANPDAAEARFSEPRMERTTSGVDVDDDRDGRMGEDPWSDVDGDGFVTWMRVEDPDGTWREDPTDERALVEADASKGERGRYLLHREGRDLDGDEAVAEDPIGAARLDRNFSSGWRAHTPGAGLFPSDEPEAQGLMEFVMARPNLALVLVYGSRDTLVEAPKSVPDDAPSVKRIPPEGLLASDAAVLAEVGRRYVAATESAAKGEDGGDAGSFARWCYDHRGILSAELALWDAPSGPAAAPEDDAGETAGSEDGDENGDAAAAVEETPEGAAEQASEEVSDTQGSSASEAPSADNEEQALPADGEADEDAEPGEDAKFLQWVDSLEEEAWRFLPWTPFEHPELGRVEIGGFAPFARIEPPRSMWPQLVEEQLAFLEVLPDVLPRLSIERCAVEPLATGASGAWRLTAVVRNDGLLPAFNRSARRTRAVRPPKVRPRLPEGATLLAGSPQTLVRDLPGSGGRVEFEWIVLAEDASGLAVVLDSEWNGETTRIAEAGQ